MRPEGKNYTLYYAHLDSQTVSTGQDVKLGDTIGLVGNTGNAINTPPHLHFGIYARGGAVDPLPFIDNRIAPTKEISARRDYLQKWVRLNKKAKAHTLPNVDADTVQMLAQGAAVRITAVTADWYRVQLHTGKYAFINDDNITDKPLREIKTDTIARLLDEPVVHAAAMAYVPGGTTLPVIGSADQYYLVQHKNLLGWVLREP
jgi:uncharacterized protein YgiM (DUF1202 family)